MDPLVPVLILATGAAWWQGDEGPYWGHNAILRVAPYREHCVLPTLPGRPPLGGEILSHDQVEAVLMRRAGYEVRVLPVEDGSFEENPPTLPAYSVRDLRWCNGNMQYVKLLGRRGFRPLGRLQLLLAILMYLGSPMWLGFLAFGFAQVLETSGIDPADFAAGLKEAHELGITRELPPGQIHSLKDLMLPSLVRTGLITARTKELFENAGIKVNADLSVLEAMEDRESTVNALNAEAAAY